MKINEHTALLTPRVLLVPYSAHHVPTYHEWMQDPAIREATASEPLSLDEEYAMQRSWRDDGDKLTFIVCVPPDDRLSTKIRATFHDAPARMVGDVNLFLVPDDEDEDDEDESPLQNGVNGAALPPPRRNVNLNVVGELEIMIASAVHQNRGLGAAVLSAFLVYIRRHLDGILAECAASATTNAADGAEKPVPVATLKHLRVRIGATNARSLRLFEKAGFVRVSETPNFFGELELRKGLQEGVEWPGQSVEEIGVVELEYEMVKET